jgi:hypothetical protein
MSRVVTIGQNIDGGELNFTDLVGHHTDPVKRVSELKAKGWKGKAVEIGNILLCGAVLSGLIVASVATGGFAAIMAAPVMAGAIYFPILLRPEGGLVDRGIKACKKGLGIVDKPSPISFPFDKAENLETLSKEIRPIVAKINEMMPSANANQITNVMNHLLTGTDLADGLRPEQFQEIGNDIRKVFRKDISTSRWKHRERNSDAAIQVMFLDEMANSVENAEVKTEMARRCEQLRDKKFLPYCEAKFGNAGMEEIRIDIEKLVLTRGAAADTATAATAVVVPSAPDITSHTATQLAAKEAQRGIV